MSSSGSMELESAFIIIIKIQKKKPISKETLTTTRFEGHSFDTFLPTFTPFFSPFSTPTYYILLTLLWHLSPPPNTSLPHPP